jgi:hypothetical protein
VVEGHVYPVQAKAPHIDVKCSKRSHSRVEVIPEADVDVTHLMTTGHFPPVNVSKGYPLMTTP